MSYYFDKSGNIKEDLLDKDPFELVDKFVKRHPKYPNKLIQKESLTSAQLRRFFGEFKQLEKKAAAMGFDKVKPLIKMVKSKATYAANPSNRKIPESFKKFLIDNINEIKTKKDFEAFMLHFEAVVGFFYGIPGVSNN
ncbi:CRISPR-associated protein Csm2 [Candidatus Magnetomoraceae bacterium gMMP-15]